MTMPKSVLSTQAQPAAQAVLMQTAVPPTSRMGVIALMTNRTMRTSWARPAGSTLCAENQIERRVHNTQTQQAAIPAAADRRAPTRQQVATTPRFIGLADDKLAATPTERNNKADDGDKYPRVSAQACPGEDVELGCNPRVPRTASQRC